MKTCDQQQIQDDIDHRRNDQIIQRMFTVPGGLQDSDKCIVHDESRRAHEVDPEIGNRCRKYLRRCIHQTQNRRRKSYADCRHDYTGHESQGYGGMHRNLHIHMILRADVSGNDNSRAKRKPTEEADQQEDQIAGRTHRRKRIAAKEVSNDQRICRIIKLLK